MSDVRRATTRMGLKPPATKVWRVNGGLYSNERKVLVFIGNGVKFFLKKKRLSDCTDSLWVNMVYFWKV
jgi:hypothetical protein